MDSFHHRIDSISSIGFYYIFYFFFFCFLRTENINSVVSNRDYGIFEVPSVCRNYFKEMKKESPSFDDRLFLLTAHKLHWRSYSVPILYIEHSNFIFYDLIFKAKSMDMEAIHPQPNKIFLLTYTIHSISDSSQFSCDTRREFYHFAHCRHYNNLGENTSILNLYNELHYVTFRSSKWIKKNSLKGLDGLISLN